MPADLSEATFFPPSAGVGAEYVWASEGGLIAVRFGQDGRLRERYFSEVQVTDRPPWLGRLARLFRR